MVFGERRIKLTLPSATERVLDAAAPDLDYAPSNSAAMG